MRIAGFRGRNSTGGRSATAPDARPPRRLRTALAIALVGGMLLPGARAAESDSGTRADAAYDSPEAAFEAAFITSGVWERGYRENREYAAAIYEMPDGSWHATAVLAGGQTESIIPYHAVPPEAVHIVGAHTHGQPHIPGDAWNLYGADFSQADLRNALQNYRATHGRIAEQLLLTSELKILRLNLDVDRALALGVAMIHAREQGRLVPAAIRGTTEVVWQLPVPVETASRGGRIGMPVAANATPAY